MYKKPLISVSGGELCQATATDAGAIIITREGGRMVKRQMLLPSGKVFGARAVSYGDAFFEFPFATLEMIGEEVVYNASKTEVGA
ncbi:MAG: hypothetical protein K2L51_07810 [Clostridiales bacterium]|nr:hypothetical protein [Clostridiales bacterium]